MLSEIGSQIDTDSYKSAIEKSLSGIMNRIQKECVDEIIEPLKEQLEDCKKDKGNKEEKLEKAKSEKTRLEEAKKEIVSQLEQIKLLTGAAG